MAIDANYVGVSYYQAVANGVNADIDDVKQPWASGGDDRRRTIDGDEGIDAMTAPLIVGVAA